MAYYSRTPRSTYRKSYGKTYRKRSTMAKPKSTVGKLYQKVNRIQRAIVPLTQNKLFYNLTGNSLIGNAGGASLFTVNLTKCSDWGRIFGTDADDEQSHAFTLQKMRLGGQINTNGERVLINTTLFLVSLTKLGISELWNTSVGTLNTMSNGTHFTTASAAWGLATFLNPRYFKIHWFKRIYTGSPGNLATDTFDLNVPFGYTHKKPIKFINPAGDWRQRGFCPNVQGNLFLMAFNNDSTLDADLAMTYNCYFEGTAV